MDLHKAHQLGLSLMKQHGLADWVFVYTDCDSVFGLCFPEHKSIYLSRPQTYFGDEARVKNTILHEIAHALVGAAHGHDHVWRKKALELGCSGERSTRSSHPRPVKEFLYSCAEHGAIMQGVFDDEVITCPKCRSDFGPPLLLTVFINPQFLEQEKLISANTPKCELR